MAPRGARQKIYRALRGGVILGDYFDDGNLAAQNLKIQQKEIKKSESLKRETECILL